MKVGAAFGYHVRTEKTSRRHYNEAKPLALRLKVLLVLLFIFSAILFFKLVSLQLVYGSYYRNLADANRTRTYVIHAPRGIIFDRNGKPLVYNIPGFREINGDKTSLINHDRALELIAKGKTNLEIDSMRQYPLKDSAAQVLGYVGQISKEELETLGNIRKYNGNDLIGKTGIESQYENILRGIDGKELIEVDAMGRKIRTLGQTDPIAGKDITLTLDEKLQQTAYDALPSDKKGSVIVSTVDGEILAMVSRPSYDPDLFTMDETSLATSSSVYKSVSAVLLDTQNQPLLNRAIGGVYPPGSTFKLVTAAAGLEKKVIDGKYVVEDTGVITVGNFSFANWFYLEQGKKDGSVNVVKAISRSNDIFFYKLAELVKVDALSAMAEKFGIGKTLGIDIPGEVEGVLPSTQWKKKQIGEQWYLGDTYHYGIGQGYLLTTPLQVNMWTATLANKGVLPQPHLLKSHSGSSGFARDIQNRGMDAGQASMTNKKFLSDKTITLIRQGMVESCTPPGGVAWPLFKFKVPAFAQPTPRLWPASKASAGKQNENIQIDDKNFIAVYDASSSASIKDWVEIPIACKTGTAQHGDEHTEPHAWITLFAPAYDPQIVVTVLVESAGQGSNVAAPVAKKVLEEWFTR